MIIENELTESKSQRDDIISKSITPLRGFAYHNL